MQLLGQDVTNYELMEAIVWKRKLVKIEWVANAANVTQLKLI